MYYTKLFTPVITKYLTRIQENVYCHKEFIIMVNSGLLLFQKNVFLKIFSGDVVVSTISLTIPLHLNKSKVLSRLC